MTTSNDFRKGMIIKLDGNLYSVEDFLHVKPGKGGAFVRTKLKDIEKGSTIDNTFRGGEKVEQMTVTKRPVQYTYYDGDASVFMDSNTFEEYRLTDDQIGNKKHYLLEGNDYEITFCEEENRLLELILPIFVNLKVTHAEPGIKGDTATNATKTAELETGLKVNVPIFIKEGELLKIDTRTDQYVERA